EGYGLSPPCGHALEAVGEKLELGLAANERAETALDRGVEARAVRARAFHGERPHRTIDPLDAQLAAVLGHEVPANQAVRGLPDETAASLARLLQPGREIHRLALRRVVHAQIVADLPDHHRPGVETDSQTELQAARALKVGRVAGESFLNRERRRDG